jgi:hypothetical protein
VTQQKAPRKPLREITPTYWRRLIEAGIPVDAANAIAWAIARYDAAHRKPSYRQKQLLHYYCPLICRAGLWRSHLLLASLA